MNTTTTLLLIAALAMPASLFAAASSGDSSRSGSSSSAGATRDQSSSTTPGQMTSSAASDAGIGIHGITKDELDHKVTAKKLLDMAVHDREGKKVGDVVDVSLEHVLPAQLAQQLASAQQQGWRQTGTNQRTPEAGQSGGTASSGPANARSGMTTGQTRSSDATSTGNAASSGSASSGSASGMASTGSSPGSASSGTSSSTTPGAIRGGSSSTMGSMAMGSPQLMVFVRVGGAFGIGGDTVAIPAAQLQFDEENERFTINQTQDEIATIVRSSLDSTGSAKQAFEEDDASAPATDETTPGAGRTYPSPSTTP